MMLNHIGLNVVSENEIDTFYTGILGFVKEYDFELNNSLSGEIFGINKPVKSVLLKNEDLVLELFVYENSAKCGYNHVCIEIDNRHEIAGQCAKSGYETVVKERAGKPDLIFVKDKSGNIFELKEKR
jgi:catechol 2,3-dioxygenase-like lactoylglutathione lyase family enzyme